MKKITTIAIAGLSTLALATTAVAQTDGPLTVTGKASPSKAGTKKKPKNTKTTVAFKVDPATKVTLKSVEYTFPKTVKISGKGFPSCSLNKIVDKGESACAKKSKVGTGTARAFAGTTQIDFTYNIYAAGSKKIVLALKSNVISTNFEGKISGSKVTVEIPESVQAPVPGLYSTVESITANLGAKTITKGKGKKKKKYNFVSTTGCKGGKQTVGVKLNVSNGATPIAPLSSKVDIPCKK